MLIRTELCSLWVAIRALPLIAITFEVFVFQGWGFEDTLSRYIKTTRHAKRPGEILYWWPVRLFPVKIPYLATGYGEYEGSVSDVEINPECFLQISKWKGVCTSQWPRIKRVTLGDPRLKSDKAYMNFSLRSVNRNLYHHSKASCPAVEILQLR